MPDVYYYLCYVSATLGAAIVIVGGTLAFGMTRTLGSMFRSIPVLPPTKNQQEEEDFDRCPLFRHVPALQSEVAWRELGDYPTPIHTCKVEAPEQGVNVSFFVKREDLSSSIYGGNKVRTLQHQLACCEAYLEQHPGAKFHVLGTGGSNQVVATTAHGTKLLGGKINGLWALPDAPDLDNTLNMLSTLSMPGRHVPWTRPLALLRNLFGALLGTSRDKVFNMGGNSVPGLLGQASGALELAEQIAAGEAPDPDAIYVAIGSSCTITGLIVGICLARTLPAFKGRAFTNKALKIIGVPIHHGPAGMHRSFGFFKSSPSSALAVTPMHGIPQLCAFLKAHGGAQDLEEQATRFLMDSVEIVADKDVVGKYGEHSKRSLWASGLYDQFGSVVDAKTGSIRQKDLWLCGHFVGKPFSVILQRAAEAPGGAGALPRPQHLNVILWQTKSAVQPRGALDEWEAFCKLKEEHGSIRRWSDRGRFSSILRVGAVSDQAGADGYRHLMTAVDLGYSLP